MRVAVLWTKLSGYLNVALMHWASRGCEILVVNEGAGRDAPFEGREFEWIIHQYEFSGSPEFNKVVGAVESFEPDVILCSWHVPVYQRACLRLRGRAVRVGCGDNQWRGTLSGRQLGRARWASLKNESGKAYTHVDIDAFGKARALRRPDVQAFVCAMRLSPEKGIRNAAKGRLGPWFSSAMAPCGRKFEILRALTGGASFSRRSYLQFSLRQAALLCPAFLSRGASPCMRRPAPGCRSSPRALRSDGTPAAGRIQRMHREPKLNRRTRSGDVPNRSQTCGGTRRDGPQKLGIEQTV
jgi:hypothetical protein